MHDMTLWITQGAETCRVQLPVVCSKHGMILPFLHNMDVAVHCNQNRLSHLINQQSVGPCAFVVNLFEADLTPATLYKCIYMSVRSRLPPKMSPILEFSSNVSKSPQITCLLVDVRPRVRVDAHPLAPCNLGGSPLPPNLHTNRTPPSRHRVW